VLCRERNGRVMWIMAEAGDGVAIASTVIARVYRERWGMWTRGVRPAVVSNEDEHALLFGCASAGARMTLDHALRGQEVFDFLTEHGDVIVFLCGDGEQNDDEITGKIETTCNEHAHTYRIP
jgi:hypothetical protein